MRRRSGFTLIELMIAVAIIGILASIAIPSFVRYIRTSETVEAVMSLRRMYDGAVTYYLADHANAAGVLANQRFPGNAGPTPVAGIPRGVRVNVPLAEWKSPAWLALDFAVDDAVRYQYSFQDNGGIGLAAFGLMVAQGDLNGNGVPSTFSRSCTGVVEGVRGGPGVFIGSPVE